MIYPISTKIDILKSLQIQKKQWSSKIMIEGSVAAGEQEFFTRNVSQMGHFLCARITGTFSTLHLNQLAIEDDGIDHLRFQLSDNTGNRKLFDDYIPGSHFLSPGRVKDTHSTTVFTTDDPSNQLFYPDEFVYIWEKNSSILLDVKNDSDTTNYFQMTLHGYRVQE